ncbi:hypothetical protein NEISICOT_01146 [Neisseria sicca ATCC 29256]|uniref:Uncharacterized protein n=1 Tax=Neisseria sicca ATCC 29256 TaxID=547045 RepID=C6M3J8_NEISI|nr:hypothetical protein NEISICOT_01146 [Neisseria sicca ATCC 29256]
MNKTGRFGDFARMRIFSTSVYSNLLVYEGKRSSEKSQSAYNDRLTKFVSIKIRLWTFPISISPCPTN